VAEEFDVIVLGGGPAGENAAERAVLGGLRVALVEKELIGGECSYWACIPSKTLLRPGAVMAAARRLPGVREAITGRIDTDQVLARRNYMVSDWHDDGQIRWADSIGLTVARGDGVLDGERAVSVRASDGARRDLTARKAVVVATGSVPVVPPTFKDISPWLSRDATSSKRVPERLAVVGGGVVAVEMAQAWHTLGSGEVTVVVRGDRLLERSEPFAGELLAGAFAAEGIGVRLGVSVDSARREGTDGPVTLTLDSGDTVVADEVLVATGRRANTEGIGLESVGLDPTRPIAVDDQLRATGVGGGWLYAIGDVNGRNLLTHMGKYQGRLVGDLLAGRGDPGATAFADREATPAVVFTEPQVGSVGHTEESARAAGVDVGVADLDMSEVAGVYLSGDGIEARARIVVDRQRSVLVGATFVGPDISELVHQATVAIIGRVPLDRLWHCVPSFPSVSEVWLRLLTAYGL
jgi:dihydrolipoamide dehydrogenase